MPVKINYSTCVRIFLCIINFFMWLAGVLTLAFGAFLKLSKYIQYTLDPVSSKKFIIQTPTDLRFSNFAYIIMCFGAVLILISVLGTCGAKSDTFTNRLCITVYGICVLILIGFQLSFYFLFISGVRTSSDYFNRLKTDFHESLLSIFKSAIVPDQASYEKVAKNNQNFQKV